LIEKLKVSESELADIRAMYNELEDQLQSQKARLEGDISTLSTQLRDLQLILSQELSRGATLDSQLASIQERHNKLALEKQTKEAELARTVSLLEEQLARSVAKWEAAEKDLIQSKQRLGEANSHITTLESRVKKAEKEALVLKDVADTNKENWQAESTDLQSRIAALDDVLSSTQQQNAQLLEALTKVREANGGLNQDLEDTRSRLQKLQADCEDINAQKGRLSLQYELTSTELKAVTVRYGAEKLNSGNLAATLEDSRRENADLSAAVAEVQSLAADLNVKLEDVNAELEQERSAKELLQREYDTLKEEEAQAQASVAAYQEEVASLEDQLTNIKSELAAVHNAAKQNVEELQAQIENGNDIQHKLKAEQEALLLEVEQLQGDLESKVDEIANLAQEAGDVSAAYEEALESISTLEQDHEEFVRAAQAQFVESKSEYSKEIESLKATLKDLEHQIANWVQKDKDSFQELQLIQQRMEESEKKYAERLCAAAVARATLEKTISQRTEEARAAPSSTRDHLNDHDLQKRCNQREQNPVSQA